MNAIHYIKLLLRYTKWLIAVPIICAITVFLLTKNAKKQYTSSTTLYTGVASGYSITSTEDERLDYFAVNNAFDNLLASAKSRETIQQVALHLLAEHLVLTKPDVQVLSPAGFESLKIIAGRELLAKVNTMKDVQSVYTYISFVYSSKTNNVIAGILSKPGSYYSINDLKANLLVTRINTSDMIQIVYSCNDPAVCLRTLELHSNIFTSDYHRLKSDQTFSAVQYFETKLADAKTKLETSENDLKKFGQQNRIINYYEQTRYVAESKENLDKEIYAQRVTQKGSQHALASVEKKLSSRESQVANGLNLMDMRQRLSDANANLERAKVYNNPGKIAAYGAQKKQLEDSLKSASNQYLNITYTSETVPRQSLMQEYVDNYLGNEKATAGLDVLNNQKKAYLNEIDELAPLGSTLKQLDRQIDINEKEYLSILNGLHLARLRQSNLALSSNIVVQDKAYFPLQAEPSTRMLLIILSSFVGFILVASFILGREFMDSSLRSAERAKRIIKLPLAGVSVSNNANNAKQYRQLLRSLLAEQFISTILPLINESIETDGEALISIISTKANVYHSEDIKLVHQLLSSIYGDLFWVLPASHADTFSSGLTPDAYAVYSPTVAQVNYKKVQQLVPQDLTGKRFIIYVSPTLSQHSLPAAFAKAAVVLMAISADDTWNQVDRDILAKTRVNSDSPFFTWLTNIDEANLDTLIGEIPKKRSWLRKKVKKIMTLNLR